MKRCFILLSLGFVSCATPVQQIGSFNVLSTRNYSNKEDYKLLSVYSGASENLLRKSRFLTVDAAVAGLLQKTPYGEYLANAKLYRVGKSYYAVSGDVWGLSSAPITAPSVQSSQGFSVGDTVVFVRFDERYLGVVSELRDRKCLVKYGTQFIKVDYTALQKK